MATPPSGTVLKAFAVLHLFHQYSVLGVRQCADLLDLPRPTAHRMLHSLATVGALERTPSGRYRLALDVFEIGAQVSYFRSFWEVAQRPLEVLASRTGLQSHLAVRVGTDVVYLLTASSTGHSKAHVGAIGSRNPVHSTALGKLLLAYAPDAIIEDALRQGLPRLTPYTTTQPQRLRDQLEQIQKVGYAHVAEERWVGTAGTATAIRDQKGRVVAGVGVTCPAERFRARRESLSKPLRSTATTIERNLAVRPPL